VLSLDILAVYERGDPGGVLDVAGGLLNTNDTEVMNILISIILILILL